MLLLGHDIHHPRSGCGPGSRGQSLSFKVKACRLYMEMNHGKTMGKPWEDHGKMEVSTLW